MTHHVRIMPDGSEIVEKAGLLPHVDTIHEGTKEECEFYVAQGVKLGQAPPHDPDAEQPANALGWHARLSIHADKPPDELVLAAADQADRDPQSPEPASILARGPLTRTELHDALRRATRIAAKLAREAAALHETLQATLAPDDERRRDSAARARFLKRMAADFEDAANGDPPSSPPTDSTSVPTAAPASSPSTNPAAGAGSTTPVPTPARRTTS